MWPGSKKPESPFASTRILFLLLGVTVATTTSLSGCQSVHCPLKPNTGFSACKISNQTLDTIGLISYPISIPSNPTIAWTLGSHLVGPKSLSNPSERQSERIFYLGTPPALELQSDALQFGGCAIYITGSNNANIFYDPALVSDDQSHCESLLGAECGPSLSTLLSTPAKNADTTSSTTKTCLSLAASIKTSFPPQCAGLNTTTEVVGVPLTGTTAQLPISSSENSTSNCYPTLPKSNVLTRVFSYNITTTNRSKDLSPATLGETPLLTVFYPTSNNSAMTEPSVQFSCLRTIDLTDASVATMKNGSSEKSGAERRASMGNGLESMADIINCHSYKAKSSLFSPEDRIEGSLFEPYRISRTMSSDYISVV
ncbi:hypothetical protein BJ875DRAFT_514771 [Amylocarpus encephaloides]|uniref:Uncharacterized protein n=1 Tax=Amylocarpus encephaloides TaxID=45428 RepID=A0A9P7YTA7_9HELO|nr:hypothetical protein BJ875DRAFT_514771 [Amylocarpus encephaloides]